MFAEFTRTSLIPLLAGLVSFAVCALFSGMFVNWVPGVENWLIGESWGALLGSFVTRKYLARGRQ